MISVKFGNAVVELVGDIWRERYEKLQAEHETMKRETLSAQQTNTFDAARLRRVASLVGAVTPDDDSTLLGCAGTVLGSIARKIESDREAEKLLHFLDGRKNAIEEAATMVENLPGNHCKWIADDIRKLAESV